MSQLASDPTLTQTSVQATDLLAFLRPVLNAQGTVTGYAPCNITANNFAVSAVALGLLQLGQTLPTTAPEGGGLWMDGGAFAYSTMSGATSGVPLSPQATAASLAALLAAIPAMGAGTNFDGFQNNAGVVTQVDDGK
ncbi:hypothetical protein NKW43_14230 [Gluconobacter albidus]|uniref:hypothetical protein n=1 Tax=Gluconobacter albidus TaxID=318683 RepID=UPI0020A194C5|nr:hypothetical protein [Gluconobacter albidus]MCP1274826.1 hypothetical protein [Gluconobacter albidus]